MAEEHSSAAEFTRFHSQNDKRNIYLKIGVWMIAVLLIAVISLAFSKMLFSLETIVVDGTAHYSYTQILKAADLEKGDLIFFVSEKKLNQKLVNNFAFVRSVKVEKQYPNTITLTIEEEVPQYYVELQKEYFLLSAELRVLGRYYDEQKLLEFSPDVQFIELPDVSRAVVADWLVFASESLSRHTDEALTYLASSRLYEGVTHVDFSNRFDLTVVYENRMEIHMGSFTDFPYKLDLALGMVHAYPGTATGKLEIIYNADGELEGIATVDKNDEES